MLGESKHTLLGDGGQSNACSLLINRDYLVPNRPHKRTLFVRVCTILDLWLVELVVFGEGALPLVCFSGLDMEHVNDFVHGHLHGIVKKVTPSPAHPQ